MGKYGYISSNGSVDGDRKQLNSLLKAIANELAEANRLERVKMNAGRSRTGLPVFEDEA